MGPTQNGDPTTTTSGIVVVHVTKTFQALGKDTTITSVPAFRAGQKGGLVYTLWPWLC